MSKFKVEVVETYRRYVEVEAEDEDAAYQKIDDKINDGKINLPRDSNDYKYNRELFVSEIKNRTEENKKMNNTPVYEFEDAINFIAERCDVSKDIIEKVLLLEEDYMRSVGIVADEHVEIYANKVKEYLLSDEVSTSDIEVFLGYQISWDVLEELEDHIDEVMEQMPNETIKEYYDRFVG